MKELCISVRKNKGVSSECDVCHINGHLLALPDKDRTDDEYELAKYALGKHFLVVQRFRSDERAGQMQSKRDFRIKHRNGVSHSMKDKAANRSVQTYVDIYVINTCIHTPQLQVQPETPV